VPGAALNFVYILEQYYAHGRRQHNKRSGASATLDSGSVGCDAERLKEMASRWSGKSARPAGETAGEYMHIPSRAPLSGEQRAQAEEAADCARRERRGKMQRKARAMTRGGGMDAAAATAAAMLVMAVLFNPAVGYHQTGRNGLQGDTDNTSLDEHVKLMQDHQKRTEACYQSGGGMCRFFL